MDYLDFKFDVATAREVEQYKKATLEALGEIPQPVEKKPEAPLLPKISEELMSYLLLIERSPGFALTNIDKFNGIPKAQGNRRRAALQKLGLIEIIEVQREGRGRSHKSAALTELGENMTETKRKQKLGKWK